MDLKRRLRMAFVIIIFLPLLMVCGIGKAIITYQVNSIQETYDVESNTMQLITNPLQILNRVTRDVYNRVKLAALKNPEYLENINYIKELNNELKDKYSFIVARKGNEIIFEGNSEKLQLIKNSLPQFGVYSTDVDGGIYVGGKNPFLLKQQDFYYSDGTPGTIFVITDVNTLVPQIKASAIQAVVSFIMIIVITALILIVWLYRGILRPLNTLKQATNEMKKGNLNFSISGDPDDEIGQLCENFEEMRIHLKELIESKMQYEQEVRELISNISHDLKTPLTAIKGYSEGILDGVADTPEKRDKYIKTIYSKANDMSVLVDELSLYSKIDSNTTSYVFSTIDVGEYFGDCIDEVSLDLELKNIELGYENTTAPDVKAIADAEQLKRVINNIIGNSVKYLGKKKGKINVRIKELGEFIQVQIEDNGVGIPAKDLPYIFDRFYRADASRNSKKGGSGLGLAIAKKIIEEHQGRIWASSDEGFGTSIFFTLKKWSSQPLKTESNSKSNKDKKLQVKD